MDELTTIGEALEAQVPLRGQRYAHVPLGADYVDDGQRRIGVPVEEANLMTSYVVGGGGRHKVIIDVDMPVHVVSSSTPGHCHLYIDHELTWDRYAALLEAFATAGIIEQGYLTASLERGHTAVRLPWVRKSEIPA